MLTELDKLKHRKNVLIMSISYLPSAIGKCLTSPPYSQVSLIWITDPAFWDRADIVQCIELPPTEAIFDMLRWSLIELIRKGLGVVAEVVRFLVFVSYSYKLLTHSRISQIVEQFRFGRMLLGLRY